MKNAEAAVRTAIETYAASLGVTPAAAAKARWVADLMKADGLELTAMTEDARQNAVMAYMDAIGKKIESIQNTYLTRGGARSAMASHIRTLSLAAR